MKRSEFLTAISFVLLLAFVFIGCLFSAGCQSAEAVCTNGDLYCPWDPYRVWMCEGGQWQELAPSHIPCVDGEWREDLIEGSDCGDLEPLETTGITGCYSFYCHIEGYIDGCEACERNQLLCDPYPKEYLP